MKTPRPLRLSLTALMAFGFAPSLWSQTPVTIANPGFESPVVAADGATGAAPTGWASFNGGAVITLNPSSADDLTSEAPEGSNVALLTSTAAENGLSQTLTTLFQANADYTLSVKVANTRLTSGFPGYRVQLVANGTVLAEDDNLLAVAEDAVVTSTVNYSYNAGLHAALVGQPLQIRLLSKGLAVGEEIAFDDVQMSVVLGSPVANSGGPYSVVFGGSLTLNGSASVPSDGQTITSFEWDLDGDGDYDEGVTGATPATIPNATLTAAPPAGYGMVEGVNTIRLKVTDSAAKTSIAQTTVLLLPLIVPSLEVDFQATIASEQHPTYAGEARFFHVSMNPANPGTGSYAATIVGTNNPAPRFVRNFDGPVVAYKFAGGVNNDINAVAQQGGSLGGGIITFTSTDTTFDGFGQQQAKLWTTTDPGTDIKISGANPYNVTANTNSTGGWRSLSDATGTIDVTSIAAGSVHIYYGAFSAKPSVSVVMRDTNTGQPDLTIANAHLNNDTADRTEYYLAEIDFVTAGIYDEIVFVWNAGSTNGRGIGVVVTEAVADPVAPSLDTANITDSSGGNPISSVTPLAYTVAFSELMDPATIGVDDFELLGTAAASITSVVHFGSVTTVNVQPTLGTSGTLQLQVKAGAVITDLAGNPLDTTSAIADPEIVTVGDVVAPTVVSFTSPSASGTIFGTPTITYTVAFSEFINPLNAGNFTNAGTAPFTIGAVTPISPAAPAPSVFTVEVIPSGAGTVQLQVQGTIQDPSGNSLVVPVTDPKVFTLDAGTEPARETVTIDASTTSSSTSNIHGLVFDASASDKLVVVVTGENGNPGSLAGKVNGLTYDGVALTKAVGRLPLATSPSGFVDQIYNDIWYLDNPAAATASASVDDPDPGVTGNIRADLDSRGVITAIRLSGTAPGVGATATSAQEVKSVSLLAATSGGMVIASYGMGGDGNTANTQSVNTTPTTAELTAVKQGSDWNGHVTSQTSVTSPGFVNSVFTGGNTIGTHALAAEFPGALVPSGSPYTNWSAGPFLATLTDPNPSLDFDKGGLDTGLEWVLGGDPTDASDDAEIAPVYDNTTDPDFFIFTYRRADAAAADGNTTIRVQYGSSLAGWADAVAGPNIIITPDNDAAGAGIDLVQVKIRRTLAVDGRLFVRLNAAVVVAP